MLSDEEKQHIIDRVQFEQEVVNGLRPRGGKEASVSRWKKIWDTCNSSLGLLIAGAIVSSWIVPRFQSHQQEIEWKRQIKTDNVKYRLGKMRDGFQEFTSLASLTSQAIALGNRIESPSYLSADQYQDFQSRLRQIHTDGMKQSAKILALLIYFPDQKSVRQAIFDYNVQAQKYIDTTDRFLEVKYQYSRAKNRVDAGRLEKRLSNLAGFLQNIQPLNAAYDVCIAKINNQILSQETKYEGFNFLSEP